jgi:hypothetical protein
MEDILCDGNIFETDVYLFLALALVFKNTISNWALNAK